MATIADSSRLTIWDLEQGRPQIVDISKMKQASFISEHEMLLVLEEEVGFMRSSFRIAFYDLRSGVQTKIGAPIVASFVRTALSVDGKYLLIATEDNVIIRDARSAKTLSVRNVLNDEEYGTLKNSFDGRGMPLVVEPLLIGMSRDGRLVYARSDGLLRTWSVQKGIIDNSLGLELLDEISSAAVSPAFDAIVIADSGHQTVKVLPLPGSSTKGWAVPQFNLGDTRLIWGKSGKRIYSRGIDGLLVFNAADGVEKYALRDGRLGSASPFHEAGDFVAFASEVGEVVLLDPKSGTELVSLMATPSPSSAPPGSAKISWVAKRPNGQFDAGDLERISEFSWIAPDNPMLPLPPEIFMRDYFEPRLVARLLACRNAQATQPDSCDKAFPPVRPLASLNRVQPRVRILKVGRGVGADEAVVEVEVSTARDTSQPNGKHHTDVFDLRLFRDGLLVRRWPEVPDGSGNIEDWRKRNRIVMPYGETHLRHSFTVRLPTSKRKTPIIFSAYAFNEDRVKSVTDLHQSFPPPKGVKARKPKAYLINIGVNGYEALSRQLNFAVNDALAISRTLSRLDGYQMVNLTLTSEPDRATWRATKENIREVLARLAGQTPTQHTLTGVINADKLTEATPDDLVILSFSGHGYTDTNGTFYLLPSDSGAAEPTMSAAALKKFISSEELSAWLGPVDAGQLAMIIDACHSASIVASPGFKPGPMGDRGLGQLAYDKAMRILAATQSDDFALESNKLRQGLLTYALVHDGLAPESGGGRIRQVDLNRDRKMSLAEWLKYGELRTPVLYDDIRDKRLTPHYLKKDPVVEPRFEQTSGRRQTPTLFNFERGSIDVFIAP